MGTNCGVCVCARARAHHGYLSLSRARPRSSSQNMCLQLLWWYWQEEIHSFLQYRARGGQQLAVHTRGGDGGGGGMCVGGWGGVGVGWGGVGWGASSKRSSAPAPAAATLRPPPPQLAALPGCAATGRASGAAADPGLGCVRGSDRPASALALTGGSQGAHLNDAYSVCDLPCVCFSHSAHEGMKMRCRMCWILLVPSHSLTSTVSSPGWRSTRSWPPKWAVPSTALPFTETVLEASNTLGPAGSSACSAACRACEGPPAEQGRSVSLLKLIDSAVATQTAVQSRHVRHAPLKPLPVPKVRVAMATRWT
jgi:hypothetical protein